MIIQKIRRLSTVHKLINHPAYQVAKQGDLPMALTLVDDIINIPSLDFSGYICPVIKKSGNKIPLALAMRIAEKNNIQLCCTILLEHSKQNIPLAQRISYNPLFSGNCQMGNYIIVDDVFTSGKTLKHLKIAIERSGGKVLQAMTIGSSKSTEFEPTRLLMKSFLAKFPNAIRYFDPLKLTSPEIRYLMKFNSLQNYHLTLNNQIYLSTNI